MVTTPVILSLIKISVKTMDLLHTFQFFTHLDAQLGTLIAANGNLIYMLLFAIIFCEIGFLPLFFLPGDPLIFIAGSFCKVGSLNLPLLILTLGVAAFFGNVVNYRFGAKVGEKAHGGKYQGAINKTQRFYEKYGQLALFVSPFIAVIRTFAPFLAGVSHMPLRKYSISSTMGTTIWIASLTLAGYFFSEIPFIHYHMASIVLVGFAIGLAFVLLGAILSRKKTQR
jgi:membrane-associated protein